MLADDKNKEFTYLKRNLEEILNWSFLMCASCGELITIIWAAPLQFACHHSSASMLLLKVHPFEYVDLHFNLHISSANITSLLGNDTTLHLIFCNIATNCTKMAILEFPIRQSAPNYIVLKYICVSRFRVLPAQYQILSSCPSLLYVHGGPMGILNIRSENFWVNQNEKCENILSIRSGSCAEELPISEGELQWKMGCNIQRRVKGDFEK